MTKTGYTQGFGISDFDIGIYLVFGICDLRFCYYFFLSPNKGFPPPGDIEFLYY